MSRVSIADLFARGCDERASKKRRLDDLGEAFSEEVARGSKGRRGRRPGGTDGERNWPEKHRPEKVEELACSKKRVKEVEGWLRSPSGSNLLVLVGPPGAGKSTAVEVICETLGLGVHKWSNDAGGLLRRGPLEDGDIAAFRRFLLGVSYRALGASDAGAKENGGEGDIDGDHIAIIEELPLLRSDEDRESLRLTFLDFLSASSRKAVLVYSDVSESSATLRDLEREVSPDVLSHPSTYVLQMLPVTETAMLRALKRVCKREKLSLRGDALQQLATGSRGDVRHVLMALQFGSAKRSRGGAQAILGARDTFLSNLHAIGKLLRGKRLGGASSQRPSVAAGSDGVICLDGAGASAGGDTRPPLAFTPQDVMQQCDFSCETSCLFLLENMVPFFTSVHDIADAFEDLSTADLYTARIYSTTFQRDRADPVYPHLYADYVAGWAVPSANRSPSASAFRPIRSPKWFSTVRERADFEARLGRARLRRAANARHSAPWDRVAFITEVQPAANAMAFHSTSHRALQVVRRRSEEGRIVLERDEPAEEAAAELETEDDIEEW